MTTAATETIERPGSGWTPGRIAGLVASGIVFLVGALLLLGGLGVIGTHLFLRDDDGFYNTDDVELEASSFAIVSDDIDLSARAADWSPDEFIGDLRLRATDTGSGAVFVGIGRTADVEQYLDGVAHSEMRRFGSNPGYTEHAGKAPSRPPGEAGIWVSQSEGPGEQAARWEAETGNWTAVVMNADAVRGIAVEANAGAQIGWLIWVGVGLALIGLVGGAVAVVLILALRNRAAEG